MSIRPSIHGAILFAVAALLPRCAASAVEIREWPVPWENTRPRDPSVAPDGRVWFVGQTGNYLAVFDPSNEKFERYDLPPRTAPHTVVVDAGGQPWVAGNGNGTVLRYGSDGKLRQTYTVPEHPKLSVRDPHTIAFDGKGGLWFTMQAGNAIAHLDVKTGAMRVAPVASADTRPYGIVATPDGNAWAVLFGTNRLARIERASMKITEIELPRAAARPRRLGLDATGTVWYVDYAEGYLGRHDPESGKTEEWPAPSKPSAPYAMTMDGKGRPWFFETKPDPNLLQTFDPATKRFATATPAQNKGEGAVRHMVFDAPRNSFWFGTDRNTLGRAKLE